MRPFYVYKAKNGFFYVQFSNEQLKKRLSALSTRQRNYNDALRVACSWFKNGIPSREGKRPVETVAAVHTFISLVEGGDLGKTEFDRVLQAFANKGYTVSGKKQITEKPDIPKKIEQKIIKHKKTLLVPFLENFWSYETSPYVQDKLIHKQKIGKRHCYDSKQRVLYWEEYFGREKTLEDLSTSDLKAFERHLADRSLATGTMNHIILVGKTACKWAVANKKITENPCLGLTRYGKEIKPRGILSTDEVQKLFKVKWSDERARVASLVAMTCGLRLGEVLALRVCDIGETRLSVQHSWSTFDGLKSPKNNKVRVVPVIPSVRAALLKLARTNPFGWDPDRFIFYGTLKGIPVVENVLTEGFKAALYTAGISETQRKERNIVFHSWRHYYAKIIADRVEQRQAQLALGHLTAAMTEHYADHKTEMDMLAIEQAVGDAFKDCVIPL